VSRTAAPDSVGFRSLSVHCHSTAQPTNRPRSAVEDHTAIQRHPYMALFHDTPPIDRTASLYGHFTRLCASATVHIFIYPAAPRGATKPFCPRRKCAGPTNRLHSHFMRVSCWALHHPNRGPHPLYIYEYMFIYITEALYILMNI
jgi:hypothetical protein